MVYTVEDVVKEIRDIKTRESLNVVLYTLKFKEPSSDAIRFGKILFIYEVKSLFAFFSVMV